MTSVTDAAVIVTGAASGIGRAIARRLLADGARVALTDIDAGALPAAIEDLPEDQAERALLLPLDVTDEAAWEEAVEAVHRRFGGLTGLVNNAGITRDATMLKMTPEQFDAVLQTHLRASWLGCRAVIPRLREAGGGAIVNISSSGRHGVFGQTNYSPAKAGIVGLTKSVALEQARYGIRCNAVAPGAIETRMTEQVPEHVKDAWRESIVMGRLGKPEEIAAGVAFLLSEDASYINAHVLDINGGEPHL